MLRFVVTLLSVFCVSAQLLAENLALQTQYPVQYLSEREGLTPTIVGSIVDDKTGFVWVGTQSGLNRYDGVSIKSYVVDESNPNGLLDNNIRDLLSDSEGSLWVGTREGVVKYNPLTDDFDRIRFPEHASKNSLELWQLAEDHNGTIWVSTERGLWTIKRGDSDAFLFHLNDLTSPRVKSVFYSSSGEVYIGTERRGLWILGEAGVDIVPELSRFQIRDIVESKDSELWIATERSGVWRRDNRGGKFRRVYPINRRAEDLSDLRSRVLLADSLGKVWIGTDKGLVIWDGEFKKGNFYSVDQLTINLTQDPVYELHEDRAGNLWVGTMHGLVRFNIKLGTAPRYSLSESLDNAALTNSFVQNLSFGTDGRFVVAIYGGIGEWDWENGTSVFTPAGDLGLADTRVTATRYIDDALWIGTRSGGAYRISDGKVTETFRHNPNDSQSISSDAVSYILQSTDGSIWIATYGGGLNKYLGNGRFARYNKSRMINGEVLPWRIYYLVEDRFGDLWISDANGVDVLNTTTHEIRSVSEGHFQDTVFSLLLEEERVWMATWRTGLVVYDVRDGSMTYSDVNKTGRAVYSTIPDGVDLWLSGPDGIRKVSRDLSHYEYFDYTHGFQRSAFASGAFGVSDKGTIAYGSVGGINVFEPRRIDQNSFIPPVVLTGFEVNHKSTNFNLLKDENDRVKFDHRDSSFKFSFAALNYHFPEKNQYKYKLEGFDDSWVDAGTTREVTYTNLDPGSYVLRVQGSNNDGVWNTEGLSIPFVVKAAPWATWWAFTFYAAFAVFLMYQFLQLNNRLIEKDSTVRINRRIRRYLESLETTNEAFINADEREVVTFANEGAKQILGRNLSQIMGHKLFQVFFQNSDDEAATRASLESKGVYEGQVDYVTEDGVEKVVELRIRKVNLEGEDAPTYVGVASDATDRVIAWRELTKERDELKQEVTDKTDMLLENAASHKRMEIRLRERAEEKESVLRNVHDRVNDSLQMLTSLLSIQASKNTDKEMLRVLDESQQRLKSLALIHETLYESQEVESVDMSTYVDALATGIYRRLTPDGVNVHFDKRIDDVKLDINQAVPCGLIICELVTNALEHGFAKRTFGSGNLRLELFQSANECVLIVADDGHGLPNSFSMGDGSMGMEIVSILTEQLAGQFKLIGGLGTTFEVRFPLSKESSNAND